MRKSTKIIIICIIVLSIFTIVTSFIDSSRVRNGVEPKFTIKIVNDEEKKVTYWGAGYKVIRYVASSTKEPYESSVAVKYGGWFMKYELPNHK